MRSLADLMRNFLQIGYVTDDIDAAASYLESTFGTIECVRHFKSSLGRGNSGAAPGSFVVVDGVTAEEWLIDVALVNAGATNLEIIRPVGGAVDLYRGAIRPSVPATLHHLGFRIDDFDAALMRADKHNLNLATLREIDNRIWSPTTTYERHAHYSAVRRKKDIFPDSVKTPEARAPTTSQTRGPASRRPCSTSTTT